MATPRDLTVAHKKAQGRIGTQTVARMRTVWRHLDGNDLDGSFERWLAAALPIVKAQHTASTRTAAVYLAAFRSLHLPGRFAPVLAAEIADDAVQTSLLVTGPVSIKKAMTRGISLDRAMDVAEASSAASAMRLSLDGGRQTVIETLRADPAARGWERVASGNACAFCSELDGKFHRDDTADFPAHDGCSCSQEPVYA